MKILLRDLLGLPVYTESGTRIGRVANAEMDTASHTVERFLVTAHLLQLPGRELVIHRSSVRSITADKVVVADTAIVTEEESSEAISVTAPVPSSFSS